MKKLIYSLMFAGVLLAACQKPAPVEPTPDPEPEVPAEAKLLSFQLVNLCEDRCTLYDNDKVVEIVYLPEEFEALKNATATVTVSEGATITPDPSVAADYTKDVEFTVTNGEVSQKYTVQAVAATIEVKCEPVWSEPKTYGALGVAPYTFNDGSVGFSGVDKFVTHDCQVFDLDGNKVGNLNTTGLPNQKLLSVSNDVNGVLVATVAVSAAGYSDGPADGDDLGNGGGLYAWLDGWDKAPVKVWGHDEAPVVRYMSASGDLKGSFINTIIAPGRSAEGTMFHTFVGVNGDLPGTWYAFNTRQSCVDGNWGQIISAASGDPNGIFFIMDSRGNNEGMALYARTGINGDEVALNGTLWDDHKVEEEGHSGLSQYGNYSIGHVRGFTFNNVPYAIASTSGWAAAYFTIQPADPEKDYLLRTEMFSFSTPRPSSAYVYDAATGVGHIIITAAPDYFFQRYDIVRNIL